MSRWRIVVSALLLVGVGAIVYGFLNAVPHRRSEGDQARSPVASAPAPSGSSATRPVSPPAVQPQREAPSMYFTGLQLETGGDQPQACLNFSKRIDASPSVHIEDFIRTDPAAKVSLLANGNRVCIAGLAFDKRYTVTIAAGLPAEGGVKTLSAETVPVAFGEMPPQVAFADSGFILSRDQVQGLPIETVNVDKVKVTVARIGDRILARTELGKSWQDTEGEWDEESQTQASTIAVPVWSGILSVKRKLNERVVTGFPIADVLGARKPGAYSVKIERVKAPGDMRDRESEYDDRQKNQRWIFDTDLMLTSFAGQDGLHVFVRSLKTAKPVAGAEVSLIATDNDELGRAKTDDGGQAVFAAGLTRGTAALAPRMLMAYLGDDFTAMELNRPGLDLSDQGIDGREEARAVDVFLYTDRGIYRPGETIDAVGLVRDRTGKAMTPTPITLSLKRPDGVEAGHWRVDPDEDGGVFQAIPVSPTAQRGNWRIEATLAGDKTLIGQTEIQVQDFVPQRLKVTLTTDAKALTPDSPATVKVDARFLFGAPAADLAAEAHLSFAADPHPVPEKSWHFGLADEMLQSEPQDIDVSATDADGRTEAVLDAAKIKLPDSSLPLQATLDVAVAEPGGRATDNHLTLPVRLKPVLLGLRSTASEARVREGEKARFEVAIWDSAGQRIARDRLDYRLIELVDRFEYYEENERWHWKRFTRERPVLDGSTGVSAERVTAIETPELEWGRYRLEVTDPTTGVRSSLYVNAGWMTTDNDNPAPEKVALSLDGVPVKPGGTARLTIKPPFAGQALLTIAGSRVFQSRTLTVPAEGKTIDIEGSADWGPGAYAILSLYRPQSEAEGHAPVRAVGVVWLQSDMQDRTLSVAIDAPKVARPRGRLEVPVTITGTGSESPVFVTLAAVDEGILQLTRFISPDPNSYYFGKRRLAVDIRDDYAHLIDGDGVESGEVRQGGDAGGVGLSVVPTKTVALFSGLVKVDSNGKAMIPLDIPDFNGALRLMAVAFGPSGIGHGDYLMPVRDPVVAELSFPRFLAPKDAGRMTLLANNVEGAAGRYHVHIATAGAVAGPAVDEDLDLAKAAQKIVSYPLAGGDPGIGDIALTLTGPDQLKIEHSWQIQVRPAHFPLTLGTVAMQQPGESFTLDRNLLKAFYPGTAKVTIGFSTIRGIDLPGLIAALDRYPYGCSEQLTSTALPLVYLEDLKLAVASSAPDDQRLRVQDAIDKLLERQSEDGVFGLWRLDDHWATPFLGAYIVDFLSRAKAKGYAVPDEALARGYKAIGNFEAGDSWQTAVFWLAGKPIRGNDPVLAGQAYAAYVLARAKRADIGDLRYLNDTSLNELEPVAKAQLGAALAMMGDKVRASHALDIAESEITHPRPVWDWSGDYYRSPVRDIAIMLTLAAELGDTARVARLTTLLEGQDTTTNNLMTQEQAWLAVAAATLLTKGGDVAISVNQAAAAPAKPPLTLTPDRAAIAGGYRVDNRGQSPVFRAVTVYGVPLSAPSAMANVVGLTKTLTTMDGMPVDLTQTRQTDRLVVHLQGKTDDKAYHQMILVDMLPAGWEIDSVVPPSTKDRDNGLPWLGTISRTKSAQKRDDRFVSAFDFNANERPRYSEDEGDNQPEVPSNEFNLAYIVRAVTPGQFVLPAAVLQDMYRPPVMARTDAGALTVMERK